MTTAIAVDDRSIRVNGLRLHYRAWGAAELPALVVLHGGWENARVWDPLAQALAGHYYVLVPDQRGHGESDRAVDYAVARMVEDVGTFVDGLGLNRTVLFGFSMGAIVATMYAGSRPPALERLVIVDHGPDTDALLRAKLTQRGITYQPPPGVDPVLTI